MVAVKHVGDIFPELQDVCRWCGAEKDGFISAFCVPVRAKAKHIAVVELVFEEVMMVAFFKF